MERMEAMLVYPGGVSVMEPMEAVPDHLGGGSVTEPMVPMEAMPVYLTPAFLVLGLGVELLAVCLMLHFILRISTTVSLNL